MEIGCCEEIKEIGRQIGKLEQAQQRRLELPEGHGEIRARERDVEAISSHVSTLIRCCEQTIHQIRAIGKKEGLLAWVLRSFSELYSLYCRL